MQTKLQVYVALAEDTARKITSDYLDWASYLTMASRLYKYPYHDQLMIYAQRPDATACATYELWNERTRRYIKRGAKGIALLTPGQDGMRLRYVFDISDTGTRANAMDIILWALTKDMLDDVQRMLAAEYSEEASMELPRQIDQIAERQALQYWQTHGQDILDSVDGTPLSGYDRDAVGTSFRKAAAASIAFTVQTRCRLEPELSRTMFQAVLDWNTPAAAAELGKAVSLISGQVLRQIEMTIRNAERSVEHERTDVQAQRRLSVPGDGTDQGGTTATEEIRPDAAAVSGERASGAVHEAVAQREADGAPAGDRTNGAEPAGAPDDPSAEAKRRDRGTESDESNGVGGADEQPETSGRGNDLVGSDLRLTDYDPVLEQMSFIIPGESEQIALIDTMEAESVPATPFAFSVSKEDMDAILRTGGNTANHRLILAAEFSKGKPVEEMTQILRQVYHGGNGMVTEHGRISAWYAEDGIRFAPGGSARYTRIAQVMSWEDAARRIGELLESGQFMSVMELATAPAHERAMIAQRLWYLYGDTTTEGKAFLPAMESIRGGGFPDETARLAERLADPAFLSGITTEMDAFADAYAQNQKLLRFRFHNPSALAQSIRELALSRREYESLLTEVARPAAFITEDEMDAQLASGSSMAGGKERIYRFFTAYPAHTPKEKADYLKEEYGIGGRSHAVSGSDHSSESHDGKGIKLQKEGCPAVQLSWAQVVKRMDALIARGRYMTQSELENISALPEKEVTIEELDDDEPIDTEYVRQGLAASGIVNGEVVDEDALRSSPFIRQVTELAEQIQAEQDSEESPVVDAGKNSPGAAEPKHLYKVGDTVYLDHQPFIIEKMGLFDISLRDPSQRYPIFRSESYPRFERLLAEDERNAHLLSTDETPAQSLEKIKLKNIVLDITAQADEEHVPVSPQSVAENFRITDEHLGEGGAKTKFGNNLTAIQTLKQIEAEGRLATQDEKEILSRYVGWGGLADAFDPDKSAWADEYRQLAAILTPQEYEAARASTLNAHYTSPVVIRAMYDAVAQMGFTGGNILEPSMGVGNFFGMLPDSMAGSRLYGVELDSITGRIARQLYPKANITVAGFETTDRRDFFDLAIGNVPFGNYQVNDRVLGKLGFSIHNYFFAKAIDQVRPGGVIAFVTSRYTMDQQSPEVRKYIAQRAELLGALRLPNNAFRANAGTEVVSDIIFLQKRDRAIEIEPDWVHVGENADGLTMNSYFVQHPEMVLGTLSRENTQYGRESFTVLPKEGASLADQLHEAIGHIHGIYQEAALPDLCDEEAIDESIPADPNVRNFSYTVIDGTVYYRENSRMVKPHLNQTAQERIKGMIALRDQVRKLIDAQLDEHGDGEIEQLQQELNTLYDSYSARFGLINDRANRLAFSSDSSYYLLCSLEILDDDHKLLRKADMFTKRTIKQQRSVDHVDTSADALAVSIGERARVDLGYMAQLTGKSEADIVQKLTGAIFRIPGTEAQYVTADEYLSGNVRQKLREAKTAAQSDAAFQPNVKALEAAQPKDLEASDIDVRLGATWIAPEYIQDFMYELLNTPYYQRRAIEVHFSPHTAEWRINGKNVVSRSNVAAYTTYGTDRANAYKILEDTLNLRDVRIYDTVQDADGKEQRVLNQKATTLAQQKQQAIKDAFREWIWKDPERRQTLVTQYNELFNSIRPREYDGSHIIFAGMNPEISLREHQRNAVAHVLYGGNTLLAHQVGAGKTFEMVAAAMESKRLGLCQKPLFVVPNHLTEQWASEFIRLYPSASILVATKKDFERANRQKFCARIATGDYDAVIIGHSQFERIPVSQERQQRLLREQLDDITHGIEELKYQRGEQFSIKQLERTRKQLENRLSKLEAEERKDDVVTFEQLGVDRLYVDEAHSFKNLFLYTKMRNVAGLSQTESQKSSDMFLKCRYMDEITGGKGIVFATGTPVSNSMTELYTMQRYLQYGTLQQKSMSHFDAWASTFGETTTAIELAPEGTGYRARTRFAKFFNLPELMNVFREVADIKTADQLHLPTPQVKYETVVVRPTAQQEEMVQALSERAAAVHNKQVDPTVDNMLKITSDGRKLGLDQRLINPLLPDDPASKVNACVGNILRIWEAGQEDKLTQLVFCDISTPKGTGVATATQNGSEPFLADEQSQENTFNVYDDIREKLIAHGVPAGQIAFIHEANTEVKKKELFAKVRSGQVRVLMGSTAKMGAGTNVRATRL